MEDEEIVVPSRDEQIEEIIAKLEAMANDDNVVAWYLLKALKRNRHNAALQTANIANFMRESQSVRQTMFAYVFWRVKQRG